MRVKVRLIGFFSILVIVGAVAFIGCSGSSVFRVINNSPDEIVLKNWDKDHRLPPGGSYEGPLGLPNDFPIVITMQRQQLRFDFRRIMIPAEFSGDRDHDEVHLVFQFQDEKIYLLYPTNTTATTNIPPQPKGFPLLPIKPEQNWIEAGPIKTNEAP
jgi:hypothetical protein